VDRPSESAVIADDLFRREASRIVAALTRLFGLANLPLVEDVVQDALLSALSAWQLGVPSDPHAWLLQTAKNRAIDVLRKDRRAATLSEDLKADADLEYRLDQALSDIEADANQVALMFSLCHEELASDTHVTLILRFLCGLGPREIASAFLVDVQTIDRRLHRGRERLRSPGQLLDIDAAADTSPRLPSVLRALYLLFSEGYHGTNADDPSQVSLCAEAMRLIDFLLERQTTNTPETHALAALFAFDSARLATRTDETGVFVPLAEQDRSRWSLPLIQRGILHLSESARGRALSRWHLEAGIACEHALAPSVEATNWSRIVELYDALAALMPGPVVTLNRALALAERDGPEAGRRTLEGIVPDPSLVAYPFYWAALADLARRMGDERSAARHYERAALVSRSRAERVAYERRLQSLRQAAST
jgi:RNA polymerase sigma factor (sigma-70 family)